jgi:hypothetical protein
VQGRGKLRVKVGSVRVGYRELVIAV